MNLRRAASKGVLLFCLFIPLPALSSQGDFCRVMFGSDARLTFEPVESNTGMTVEDNIFGKPKITRDSRVPSPTGFRCVIYDINKEKKKCVKGMKYNTKRNEIPSCLSKIYRLTELCPSEIEETWPELKNKICGEISK